MEIIKQKEEVKLIQTKKTVQWLVENTIVSVFNPVDFSGYQRKIDDKHCNKIVDYLQNDFLLPTAIICATDDEFNETVQLRIVDGQHRIHAFKQLEKINPDRYDEIKDFEIPIIVLSQVERNIEINTFIVINKTSKKVDTSLAYVLKNKMNHHQESDDLSIPKAEYLAVELAYKLNTSDCDLWKDKILFEGSVRNTPQLISLNAFVKSSRVLINQMSKAKIIELNWTNDQEVEKCVQALYDFTVETWMFIRNKWSELFDGSDEKRGIIQGAIGYSAINRVIIEKMKQTNDLDRENFNEDVKRWIDLINVECKEWEPGERFSRYSSGTGYNIVAKELLNSMNYQ